MLASPSLCSLGLSWGEGAGGAVDERLNRVIVGVSRVLPMGTFLCGVREVRGGGVLGKAADEKAAVNGGGV